MLEPSDLGGGVHFWAYKEKFISLYCRLSSVLDLDALITQQALREAITDVEVSGAKQRHQLILDYIQQLDEMWRDLRWITDALQYARYKHPRGGVPITCLVSATRTESDPQDPKTDSTSSTMDYLPTPSPSPELRRRTAANDTALGSDDDGSSEVFLPTDSDYDSSDALSPRDMDLLYSSAQDLSTQALHSLGGSAPDVLQIHEIRFSKDMPLSLPLSPSPVDAAAKTLETLSLSPGDPDPRPPATPLRALANPPSKRKLLSRSHRGQYFSGPQRWLRGHGGGGEGYTGSLSEGVYTRQRNPDLPGPGELASPQGPPFVSQSSCLLLESRRGRHRDQRPHVRRIFVEPCKEASPGHETTALHPPAFGACPSEHPRAHSPPLPLRWYTSNRTPPPTAPGPTRQPLKVGGLSLQAGAPLGSISSSS
ncbi:ankyrin repeat and fibronectin type-III domain-containing protein 1-like [Gadus chalcogrammus]|uniref:ankyrin repeat and fibronectin type-III domain-containing protein 1-like n=1 Tax=Gadus chalcogrammus TaxID=1042646 RepID=UPI0024C4E2D7|nr:ankyrin repeat and fibronectin type-III domain-containing protein 1-like [Gadus chalcogrammus]